MSQTPVPPLIPGDANFSDVQTGALVVNKQSVTQLTSITTGVTINSACGTIVTFNGVITAGTTATFSVANSACSFGNVVLANVNAYSGAGIPVVASCVVTKTGFDLTLANVSTADDTDDVITIAFLVC